MNDEDRRKLIVNSKKLLTEINWSELWPKLFEHGIYHGDDINVRQWESNLHSHDNNREIYWTILTRGPEAFQKFVHCLTEIGRMDLAFILRPEENGNTEMDVEMDNGSAENIERDMNLNQLPEECDSWFVRLMSSEEPLPVVVKKSTRFIESSPDKLLCYKMRTNPHGLVLLMNNFKFYDREDDRIAAQHDETNLVTLYEQMGFVVQTFPNLTCAEMLQALQRFKDQPELYSVDSICIIIMSHGDQKIIDGCPQTTIIGTDGYSIRDVEILNFFTASSCPAMQNKPKIFILQNCRGENSQQAVQSSRAGFERTATDTNNFRSEPSTTILVPQLREYSDMLVAHSTLPGHESRRDLYTGSWFIQSLCQVMMERAHDTELLTLFQMVDAGVSNLRTKYGKCQTSVVMNYGFNKKCYLNPGYFG